MSWILKLLAGGGGGWIFAGTMLAVLGIGIGAGVEIRGVTDAPVIATAKQATAEANTRTAQCQAIHEKGRADAEDAALTALNTAAANASAAMDKLSILAAARGKSLNQLIEDIRNAPKSTACGASAPELAFRRGVQRPAPTGPAATP